MESSKRLAIGLLLTVTLVSACGSGADGSGSGGIEPINSSEATNPNTQQTSTGEVDTSAIAGVWDDSFNYNGAVDVLYWVINANGTFAYVDYLGDGYYGSSENCYHYWRGRVTTQGTDGYVFDSPGNDIPIITPVPGGSIIDLDSSVAPYHMRVVNGELAILDGSNGRPTLLLPPVPGGLDPSIPECPPEAG